MHFARRILWMLKLLLSGIPRCGYTVYVAGADDSESTAHIWEAMVALDDMCASIGKTGTAFGLGLSSHPFLLSQFCPL